MSEAELSLIWQGQRFPAEALATADGRHVRVLHPGRLNTGPGPDFRDAIVAIEGEERHGDVELHVRASAFRGHGHDQDHAYDGLALHVVYLADDGLVTGLSDGTTAPVAAFAPWLERRRADIERWLAAPALWQEPCRDAPDGLGDAAIAAALLAAGKSRFAAKVARLAAVSAREGEEAALWAALFDALGVGGDRAGFRRLAQAFPPPLARSLTESLAESQRARVLEDALVAVAGLPGARTLPAALPARLSPALERLGRPLNWPERRLAAFARLYGRAQADLVSYAVETVESAAGVKELVTAWQVVSAEGRPALLGWERTRELVLNAVLPFVATRPGLRSQAEALLTQLQPSAPYGRTAFLEANLVRPSGKRRVASALEQQGLLALLEDWCSQGGCGRCPLSPPQPQPTAADGQASRLPHRAEVRLLES
jgi:hypothetical protein